MSFDSDLVRITGGPVSFYGSYTTTNLYVQHAFGGLVHTITVSNDSTTDSIQLSYDGATLQAELNPEETVTLNTHSQTSIYIKGSAGGGVVRVFGW